jgi:hypothetical protein
MKNLYSFSCKLIIFCGLFWIELLYYYVTSNFFTCAANIAPFQNRTLKYVRHWHGMIWAEGVQLWNYGLWSFQPRDTKLERFLPKNQLPWILDYSEFLLLRNFKTFLPVLQTLHHFRTAPWNMYVIGTVW